MTLILGLTGGIATGKSSVSAIFKEYDIPIVDGDLIARAIVEPGQPALQEIVQTFGSEMLFADGTLNRKKLGRVIFADPVKRHQLDQLMDQYLRQGINEQIKTYQEQGVPLVIADIPILYEKDYTASADQVMVVYVSPEIQMKRLMIRDQLTEQEALERMRSQLPIDEKAKRADYVIDNQGTLAETRQQVVSWLTTHGYTE